MARVAVVRGGRSLEREISLLSGHHVATALRHLGHDVEELDVDGELARALASVDVVFIALHGRDGEDGTIQLTCEALGIPYTGSGPLACRLCFDKGLAKGTLRRAGLPTPPGYVVSAEAVRHMGAGTALRLAADRLGFPLAVKPAAQGSALGLSVIDDPSDLSSAVMAALDHGERVLLERFVPGAEIAIPVLGPDLEPLPAVEIRTRGGIFDFETRVSPGGFELVCPAEVEGASLSRARALAAGACSTLGVRDFARVDFRIGDDGPVILDVKTCPGLTETSILTLAVSQTRSSFEDFASVVIDGALARAQTARA
ncbi:MAG: D-alanine--D-alanine ligase family protein [Actinomycetota bacterium]